jgi:hypothetical protein
MVGPSNPLVAAGCMASALNETAESHRRRIISGDGGYSGSIASCRLSRSVVERGWTARNRAFQQVELPAPAADRRLD